MLNSHIFRGKIPHCIGSPLGTLYLYRSKLIILLIHMIQGMSLMREGFGETMPTIHSSAGSTRNVFLKDQHTKVMYKMAVSHWVSHLKAKAKVAKAVLGELKSNQTLRLNALLSTENTKLK